MADPQGADPSSEIAGGQGAQFSQQERDTLAAAMATPRMLAHLKANRREASRREMFAKGTHITSSYYLASVLLPLTKRVDEDDESFLQRQESYAAGDVTKCHPPDASDEEKVQLTDAYEQIRCVHVRIARTCNLSRL